MEIFTRVTTLIAVILAVLLSSVWTAKADDEILTICNNEDLATLLISDGGGVEEFVAKYKGKTIEFDGCVRGITVLSGNDYRRTRYAVLIYAWDYDEDSTHGSPDIMCYGVSHSDLDINIREKTNVRITAKVERYDAQFNQIVLKPVLLETR